MEVIGSLASLHVVEKLALGLPLDASPLISLNELPNQLEIAKIARDASGQELAVAEAAGEDVEEDKVVDQLLKLRLETIEEQWRRLTSATQ